jgi:hypothetical protein
VYEKRRYGQQGALTVWGFIRTTPQVWLHPGFVLPHLKPVGEEARASEFWRALELLRVTGLASFVPHVVEADTDEAAVLYPYAQSHGEPEEMAVASFAHEAARTMLADWQHQQAEADNALLIPLPTHVPDAQMFGVLRLRYQAGTEANAGWLRDNRARWNRAAEEFARLAKMPLPLSGLQHQMNIKSTSTRDQLLG